ncbi:hypothetical protein NUU61_001316 [Penicillium alfredii]|uniref:Uncharacterized protein n=1 Tax=Penicillium alfredii TaxID=1506179 RepID=A0A9W9G3W8_9EURO|nr:uncharacterized protein NUU61_001316 [Penicillium alfredii]KAJ5111686.1 hypothetical protein NUU61_001316 [Penicillium alfredii]
MIRDRDRDGAITNKQIESSKEAIVQYSATTNTEFSKKYALNQHLKSPVHKQKVYRYPNAKRVQQQVSDVIQGEDSSHRFDFSPESYSKAPTSTNIVSLCITVLHAGLLVFAFTE